MGGYTIGVDVGGTKVLGVAIDPARPHVVLALELVPTPRGAERLTAIMLSVVAALRQRAARHGLLSGVGIGIAGLVDLAGVLRLAPNLVGGDGLDVPRRLGPQLGVPLVVDNDANCAAVAEREAGVARGCSEVLYTALGTGIGGALVSRGRVVRGANGFAGEAGHMVLVPGGWRCACGRLGCWEAYASGTGLARLGQEAAAAGRGELILAAAGGLVADVRGEHVTTAALAGDGEARAVIEEFARWVALGLSNLVNVLDPELVVLGGSMVEVGDLLLAPVRAFFDDVALGGAERGGPRLEGAAFGARAAATGAALLAADQGRGERRRPDEWPERAGAQG